ncbi:unnamed protein product, partial [Mesorhabditis belari]|uniref:UBR-type domain-containing protein n=1 Tax=Mesorhabditis belari TaxID=2138241 RepID=A0AAF3F4Q4_9BILA
MDQENKDSTQKPEAEVITLEDNEEDKVVTINDVFSDSDDECQFMTEKNTKICTYPEGYKPRQAIYTCTTCAPSPPFAAICVGCAVNCHEGHTLINLYTKRRLCCDCGNSRTPNNKCTLFEEKAHENRRNVYDHNFDGSFCMYKCTWNPDESQAEPMAQCLLCEDWFHFSHLGMDIDKKETPPAGDLICVRCVDKYPWVRALMANPEGTFCVVKQMRENTELSEKAVRFVILRPDVWRKNLCKCNDCLAYLEDAGLEYLYDEDDMLSVYEKELEAEKEEEEPANFTELATRMVGDKGPDAVLYAVQCINAFKAELDTMLKEAAEKNQVVTKDHVNQFMEKIHKRRLEERERLENEAAKRARLEGYQAEDDHPGD